MRERNTREERGRNSKRYEDSGIKRKKRKGYINRARVRRERNRDDEKGKEMTVNTKKRGEESSRERVRVDGEEECRRSDLMRG